MSDIKAGGIQCPYVLAIYMEYGPEEGTYVEDLEKIKQIVTAFDYNITDRNIQEVIHRLELDAGIIPRTENPDLIAVNNGIFDYASKTLKPFSPDYCFLNKLPVNYNPEAKNVVLRNPDGTYWDVETWMQGLSDDPKIVNLLWQSLSALIRPYVSWNHSLWLKSETGCNGKGTLVQLMRNICGSSAVSITLSQFGQRFGLAGIIGKTAVLVDENDVGDYIENMANYKSAVTNDVIPVERKHKDIINYRFRGIMVFCVNDQPRIKDKTQSFYRRLIIVPFDKCFIGNERKYIKDDYLARKDVLEYVLYRILQMNFSEFDIPDACKLALDEYKRENDSIRQFLVEMLPMLKWDLAPFDFLYELYKAWLKRNNPHGSAEGKEKFIKNMKPIINEGQLGWKNIPKGNPMRIKNLMDGPESLIAEYDVKEWQSKTYTGQDPDKVCCPDLKEMYKGIVRDTVRLTGEDEQCSETA